VALRTAQYDDIQHRTQPGDVIAFAGAGPASEVIQQATRSNVSHVGVVLQSQPPQGEPSQEVLQIIESTSLDGFTGVTVSHLRERIQGYDGRVWWLPLRDSLRAGVDWQAFHQFLLQQVGKPYDLPQAIMSGLDQLDDHALLERATHAVEDFRQLFCSELVAGALEACGAITRLNASEVTPIDLCTFSIFEQDYYQLKGDREPIVGYNSVSPEGWGE
jgi:hypothetical protein